MMTHIKRILLLLFTISNILQASAQNIIYEKEDSIFIEEIAKKHPLESFQTKGDRVIALAKEFIGKDYVAGTLDKYENEPLFISCSNAFIYALSRRIHRMQVFCLSPKALL